MTKKGKKIKSCILISTFLFIAIYFSCKNFAFLKIAKHVQTTVTLVTSENSEYKYDEAKWRLNPFDTTCTRFHAEVVGTRDDGNQMKYFISAGRESGHDRPIVMADLQVGDTVDIIYDPTKNGHYYQYTFMRQWILPFAFYFLAAWVGFLHVRSISKQETFEEQSDG